MAAQNHGDLFDEYFRRADVDKDGKISGSEAVAFFQGSNLPKLVLAQIWNHANPNRADFLGRAEFYNALKLVTVAQSKRDLTLEIVKAALYGPASAKIPAPKIHLAAVSASRPSDAGATPSSQVASVGPVPAQSPGFRPALPNTTMNQPYNQSPGNGIVRPPISSGVAAPQQPIQDVGFQGLTGVGAANAGKVSTAMFSERGSSPLANLGGLPSGPSGPVAALPSKPPVPSGVTSLPSAMQPRPQVSQNGFASGPHTPAPSEQRKNGPNPLPSGSVPLLAGTKSIGAEQSKMQQILKAQPSLQNVRPSGPSVVLSQQAAGHQPQLQWPRATQTDIQKYTKVFFEVDADKDGKISGQQARDLFLSWRLPREVLKQVWDLSDQDNDSMLSVREFCIALYLMERYREGRPLPSELPSSVILDFPANVQPAGGYGNSAWGFSGFQQLIPGAGPRPNARPPGKPPLPVPAPSSDDRLPPKPQKAKVPVLEKHLVDQLSEEEQKSLNSKFQEATEANQKVEELEKEIKESREKIEFYRVKMQELVLYKSRCDSRLNEVTERAAGDKREVESLAKKYEEKYKQAGDVASKLTIEEATFRDIQESKMEMYQAIVKMEQDGSDDLQVCADSIQSNLEELVRNLSERCKKYGLRSKPTTLMELPFGWQAGIQEGAADWDEDWDKFEDEGFASVNELTLDVRNVIAPPKSKVKVLKKEKNLAAVGEASIHSSQGDSKAVKPATEDGTVADNGVISHEEENNDMRSSGTNSSARGSPGSPRDHSKEIPSEKTVGSNTSPCFEASRSDAVVSDASFSGDKKSDQPTLGTFDTSDDADSVWGSSKRHIDDLFGHGEFTLPPIRTGSSRSDDILPKKSVFADSVPGTPADGFLPQKSIFAESVPATPAGGFLSKQSIFADSVSSAPIFSSSYSPGKDGEGHEERGFNFSRFDSFRSTESGFQPQESLSRFDSVRSTRDFDSQDGGSFQQRETLSRFDSVRSTNETDFGMRFSSFDDLDPFGSGPFQSSFGAETPKRDPDAFGSSAFRSSLGSETPRSEVDPFGSVGPFRSSLASETPRADSDPFGSVGPFRSSLGNETPRGEGDYFGSVGPFRSSFGNETPRADADRFGSIGPFGSSMGSETPREGTNYFGYTSSFRSSAGSETPRGGFNSFGFGGPFDSSHGTETPRRDSDPFGAPFKSSFSSETPRGGTDSWSAV